MGRGWRWVEVGRLYLDKGEPVPRKASGGLSLGVFGEVPCIMRPADPSPHAPPDAKQALKILIRSDEAPLNFMRRLAQQGAPPEDVLPAPAPPHGDEDVPF